jgi:small-conductance mechanosensitive channel
MVDVWDWFVNGVDFFFTEILPWIIIAAVILVIGYVIARVSKSITRRVLWRIRLDHYMERSGIGQPLRSLGFRGVSDMLAALVFWFVFLLFVLFALALAPTPTVLAGTVEEIALFIPQLVGAAIVLIVGIWAATWLGDRTRSAASVSELPFPPEAAAAAVKYIIIYIVGVIALTMVIGPQNTIILTYTFLAAIGALFLALAISFGWGMRHVSENMSGYIQSSQFFYPGDHIEVMEHSGTVKSVTRYALVLVDDRGREITIPHSKLIQEVVTRTGGTGAGEEGETAY